MFPHGSPLAPRVPESTHPCSAQAHRNAGEFPSNSPKFRPDSLEFRANSPQSTETRMGIGFARTLKAFNLSSVYL
jgi:hypothetical protein